MLDRRARVTLLFSSLGHAFMHMLTAFFFIIVLALEQEWSRPYHELVSLWTLGALLVGAGALPAGWLADRWHAPGMMIVMFIGMGLSCLVSASADGPVTLLVGLGALGIFASIYHPVGIPWIVRASHAQGKALGINGVFGGLGVAAAGGATGLLIDAWGWRAAFTVPGVIALLAGVTLWICVRRGLVADGPAQPRDAHRGHTRGAMLRTFALMLLTMFSLGFVYQASQAAYPKVFDLRLGTLVGEGTAGVGLIIAAVYASAALMQLFGGYLADRLPLKPLYLGSFLVQIPILIAVGSAFGVPLVVIATAAVLLSTGALPAENMLLARVAPRRHLSLAFGVKFVIAFGTAPLAIAFVAWVYRLNGEFWILFVALAAMALLGALAALALPRSVGGRSGQATA